MPLYKTTYWYEQITGKGNFPKSIFETTFQNLSTSFVTVPLWKELDLENDKE